MKKAIVQMGRLMLAATLINLALITYHNTLLTTVLASALCIAACEVYPKVRKN